MNLFHSPTSPYVRKCMVVLHETGLLSQVALIATAGTPVDPGSMPLEQNPLGIIVSDLDGRVDYVNPAYTAIINCVVGGWNLPLTQACDREMDIFVELMRDPVAGNMVRTLFLNRQKASKLGLLAPVIDPALTRATSGEASAALAGLACQ